MRKASVENIGLTSAAVSGTWTMIDALTNLPRGVAGTAAGIAVALVGAEAIKDKLERRKNRRRKPKGDSE